MTEEQLHAQICQYIKTAYPNVIFNTDMSGLKLTIGQANKAAKLRSDRGFLDIMIFEPRGNLHGMFLEVKKDTPYKRDGKTLIKKTCYDTVRGFKIAYDHLKEQKTMIDRLTKRGYFADFYWTFDKAKHCIDEYLNLNSKL